jgi:hypothetical protein
MKSWIRTEFATTANLVQIQFTKLATVANSSLQHTIFTSYLPTSLQKCKCIEEFATNLPLAAKLKQI